CRERPPEWASACTSRATLSRGTAGASGPKAKVRARAASLRCCYRWGLMQPPEVDRLPPDSYRAMVLEAPDAILFADADAAYIDANPAAEALLGYTRDELVCLRVHDIVVEQVA